MSDATFPPLIQHMLQPEFYPHSVEAPVQLIQTHISYILLTGEYAYKVKKPLDFGFLNYSTLEKRKHFCEEELRLNQRAASEIYIDVLPLTQDGEQFRLNGSGEAVEYAVRMRQFPQDTLLSRLFAEDRLPESLLNELAIAIADFHKKATTNDYIRGFGQAAAVREAFDENYAQTEAYIGGPQTQKQFDETRAYTDRFFEEQQALFQQRIDQDLIRECHGDLHLGNICYWNDRLYLFDCIEFNEPFRFVDVMFDIAYIVMDLEVGDRPDLSALFLSTYVEQTGDWKGLEVLPIYVSRQTYVRAKVTSFLLGDPSIADAEKAKISEAAAKYYTLAWKYTQPKKGRLILMSGLSGSGKSTTARLISKQCGAVQIRSDAVRKHLAGIPLSQRGDDSLYTAEMSQKTYSELLALGVQLAQAGYSIILDAKYDRANFRQEAIAQANQYQIPIDIVYCDAPEQVRRDRLQQRSGDIADATAALIPQQKFEDFTAEEQAHVFTLDTTQDSQTQLQEWLS
ncbi:MAG: AAA family ATPase [Elainellaceae cyanobacterium]